MNGAITARSLLPRQRPPIQYAKQVIAHLRESSAPGIALAGLEVAVIILVMKMSHVWEPRHAPAVHATANEFYSCLPSRGFIQHGCLWVGRNRARPLEDLEIQGSAGLEVTAGIHGRHKAG